jgi:5-methylcytosine-specific restriction protein A
MKRACVERYCPAVVESPATRCPQHQLAHDRDRTATRGTASQRGYTSAWQQARDAYITAHPHCEPCHAAGRPGVRAVLVDHHVPLHSGGPRLDPANFTSMCTHCHARKTWRDGSRPRTKK